MGGFGSGRHDGKQKAEHCRKIDINKLLQAGCLKSGYSGGWQWLEDGEQVANIGFNTVGNKITLRYRFRSNGSDWEEIEQPTQIRWTPCRYGGERPYFRCPGGVNGRACGRNAIKLFSGGKYFLCRHCYDLAYKSQSETRADRLFRRANKRRMALGGEAGVYAWINRPKGMWQRTYIRHKAEIIHAEGLAMAEMRRMFAGKISAQEMEMYFE